MKVTGLALALAAACVVGVVYGGDYSKAAEGEVYFFEGFGDGADGRWVRSSDPRYTGNTDAVEITELNYLGADSDHALNLREPARFYGVSSALPNGPYAGMKEGKPLVVQYEVRLTKELECGGAYLKLVSANANKGEKVDLSGLGERTPFTVMFGPDRCGDNDRVHFIFRHPNPVTGKYEEKHVTSPPKAKHDDTVTHLYTLVVTPDSEFKILVDGKVEREGTLLDDFAPAVNPPKEIDDPKDTKPADWVDETEIPDPEAKKPDDWDEDAPRTIPDPSAKKPDDWDESEPETITDPTARKPSDWDDEMDGDWVAKEIPNPKCAEGGCGVWKAPMVNNPKYKGKWAAPMIANPKYRGPFVPRKIPNPEYFYDAKPAASLAPIAAVAIEVWTMTPGIMFDNILITSDKAIADEVAKESWKPKYDVEKIELEAKEERLRKDQEEADKPLDAPARPWNEIYDDVVDQIKYKIEVLQAYIEKKPKLVAQWAAGIVVGLATVVVMLSCCCCRRGKEATKKAKKEEEEEKEVEKEAEVLKSPSPQPGKRKGKAPKDDQ